MRQPPSRTAAADRRPVPCRVPLGVAAALATAAVVAGTTTAAGAGCARKATAPPVVTAARSPVGAGAPMSPVGPVAGVVVDMQRKRPLRHVTVAQRATVVQTDDEGRFTLPGVPATYDLTVVAADRQSALVVRGLHRRDPIVAFEGSGEAGPRHQARLSGTLSGAFVGKAVWVSLSSARAQKSTHVVLPAAEPAPARVGYDLGVVEWHGADTLTGDVLALGQDSRAGTGTFARQPFTLHDGDTATVELTLAPVTSGARASVDVTIEDPEPPPSVHESYRTREGGQLFNGNGPYRPGRGYASLDLAPVGLTLCSQAFEWNPYIRSMHTLCGVPFDRPLSLCLRAPPAFTAPAFGTLAAPGLAFAWSVVPRSVYRLSIVPTLRVDEQHPHIVVMQAEAAAAWPDLSALGVAFPQPLQPYKATVTALGPFATLDDAFGPRGLTDPIPAESWNASSQDLSLPVLPPPGKEEAACHPTDDAIVCNEYKTVDDRELYVLAAINKRLRYFPAFANDVGIHCVRNCEEARVYMKAYKSYSEAHPGFDEAMPLEAMPPPPPRPWLENKPKRTSTAPAPAAVPAAAPPPK